MSSGAHSSSVNEHQPWFERGVTDGEFVTVSADCGWAAASAARDISCLMKEIAVSIGEMWPLSESSFNKPSSALEIW